MAHSERGYTTNIPLADLRSDDVLLATGTTGKTSSPSTAAPAAWSFRSSISGRARSGSARSSFSTSTLRGSGRSTDTTFTPTRGRRSATPTRKPTPCSGCARSPPAACGMDAEGRPLPLRSRRGTEDSESRSIIGWIRDERGSAGRPGPARILVRGRAGRRTHDRRRDLPDARGADRRPRLAGADRRPLGRLRSSGVRRRSHLRGARVPLSAGRRTLRLPARGLGLARRVSLRLAVFPDPGSGDRGVAGHRARRLPGRALAGRGGARALAGAGDDLDPGALPHGGSAALHPGSQRCSPR